MFQRPDCVPSGILIAIEVLDVLDDRKVVLFVIVDFHEQILTLVENLCTLAEHAPFVLWFVKLAVEDVSHGKERTVRKERRKEGKKEGRNLTLRPYLF
jgi:hypothetical protein